MEARLSIRDDQQIHVAQVIWRHLGDTDEILVSSPLGQGVAELRRDAGGAHLLTADRHALTADNWSALGEKVFGALLPLDALPRWIVGDLPGAVVDELGRPLRAHPAGWDVEYADYESDRADALPTRIRIQRDKLTIRIKVDAWRIP